MEQKKARGDGFSEERRRLFLLALSDGYSVLAACALVGVSNRTAYNHRERDPVFARQWDTARRVFALPVQLAAYERALGIEEPVYVYGRLSHTRTRYSDSLLIKMLDDDKPRLAAREAKRIEWQLEQRLAEALGPLEAALARAEGELAALRIDRNTPAETVNFVNPAAAPDPAAPPSPRRGKKPRPSRLAAAKRRWEDAETFFSKASA